MKYWSPNRLIKNVTQGGDIKVALTHQPILPKRNSGINIYHYESTYPKRSILRFFISDEGNLVTGRIEGSAPESIPK